MEKEAISFCSSDGGDIIAGGRGRARLANAIAESAHCMQRYGASVPKEGKVTVDISEDVDLERVAFPVRAGELLAEEFMSPERARVVADLHKIVLPDEEVPRVGICSCHRVPPDREEEFVRRMLDSGMGVVVQEILLPRHSHTGALLKG